MADGDTDSKHYAQAFFARQPVFTASLQVWGHELLYRHALGADTARIQDGHQATLQVAVNSCMTPHGLQSGGGRILVNFDGRSIREQVPHALPPERAVVEVREKDLRDQGMRDILGQLKADGYTIAVDDFEGATPPEMLGPLADLLIIDVLRTDWADSLRLMEPFQGQGIRFLAKRVEDYHAFALAKDCDFDLFQGFFFQKPENLTNRVITATQAGRLGIVRLIEQVDPDFQKLAEAIQRDVSISYRLLSFLNSPFFGFGQQVSSIKQAMVLAGWKQLKTWLRLIILTDIAPKDKPSELCFLSAQRARFLELTAQAHPQTGQSGDRLFLTGLFSLLHSMLDLPMTGIVDNLPLDWEMKEALCRRSSSLLLWLEMAERFEQADWPGLDMRIRTLGLDPVSVAGAYAESMEWANSFFNYL